MKKILVSIFGVFAVFQFVPAAEIVGGSNILTSANASQLETWLGEGPITITRIFTLVPGERDVPYQFHHAVDGKGRTFSVIQALSSSGDASDPENRSILSDQIIGGYDPQSWDSNSGARFTPNIKDQTAFLFDLTSKVKLAQGGAVKVQTYNSSYTGINFGGHSLVTNYNFSYGSAYGDWAANGWAYGPGLPALGGGSGEGANYDEFGIGNLEVFTIADTVKPVAPAPAALLVFALGVVARRKRKS